MDLSVVVPAYGRADELGRTLEGLAAQSISKDRFEVVVVDDGSPVDLEPVARGFDRRLPLRVLRHEQNRGRAAARNTGARAARGDVILFLDADMIASPSLLTAHLAAQLGGNDQAAGTGDRRPVVVLGPIPVARGYETALGRYMERRGHMRPGVDVMDVPHRYFVSANTSLRRDLFERAGAYDERFVAYGGEDIDLGWKLRAAGARFVVAREAIAHHAYRYEIPAGARRMREFGRITLPLVFERHPELREVFHLDLVTSRGPLARGFFRLATTPPFLAAGTLAARAVGRVAPWILSYVLVGNYFRGYVEQEAQDDAPPSEGVRLKA